KNGYFLPECLSDEESRGKWIDEHLRKIESAQQQPPTEQEEASSENESTKRHKRRLKKLDKAVSALDEQEREREQKDPSGRLKRERERKRGGKPEVPTVNVTDPDARKMMFSDRTFR